MKASAQSPCIACPCTRDTTAFIATAASELSQQLVQEGGGGGEGAVRSLSVQHGHWDAGLLVSRDVQLAMLDRCEQAISTGGPPRPGP